MSYQSKNLETYPTQFYDILRRVGQEGQRHSVLFSEHKKAHRLRFTFYGFQAALKIAGKDFEHSVAKSIMVKLKALGKEGWELEFSLRDQDDQFEELRASLADAKYPPGESARADDHAPTQESTIVRLYGEGQAKKKGQ